VDGTLLVSSGHAALDGVVGGGLAAGSVTLLEPDWRGAHATAVASLFAAQGIAHGHPLVLATSTAAEAGRLLASLPLNVSRGSSDLAAMAARPAVTAAEAGAVGLAGRSGGDDDGDEGGGDEGDEGGGGGEGETDDGDSTVSSVVSSDGGSTTSLASSTTAGSLTMAAGYNKYLAPSPGGAPAGAPAGGAAANSKYCHTFDLNRRMPVEVRSTAVVVEVRTPPPTASLSPNAPPPATPDGFLAALVDGVTRAAARVPPGTPVRVVVQLAPVLPTWPALASRTAHLLAGRFAASAAAALGGAFGVDGTDPELAEGEGDTPSAVAQLRGLLLGLRRAVTSLLPAAVVLLVCDTHALPPSVAAEVRSYADTVVKLHAFGDPAAAVALAGRTDTRPLAATDAAGAAPEFADYTGLLLLRRATRAGSAAGAGVDTPTYVFKRDRKKLVIEKPHLPPEDAAPAGAGMSCAPAASPATSF